MRANCEGRVFIREETLTTATNCNIQMACKSPLHSITMQCLRLSIFPSRFSTFSLPQINFYISILLHQQQQQPEILQCNRTSSWLRAGTHFCSIPCGVQLLIVRGRIQFIANCCARWWWWSRAQSSENSPPDCSVLRDGYGSVFKWKGPAVEWPHL